MTGTRNFIVASIPLKLFPLEYVATVSPVIKMIRAVKLRGRPCTSRCHGSWVKSDFFLIRCWAGDSVVISMYGVSLPLCFLLVFNF